MAVLSINVLMAELEIRALSRIFCQGEFANMAFQAKRKLQQTLDIQCSVQCSKPRIRLDCKGA